jgi:diguanylate cyclase (GGDEF)-like protein/PAS domain S-box-containing protein
MRRFAIGVAALSLSLLLGAVDAARSETWNQLAVVAATVCGAWTVAGGVAHGDPADRFVRLHALAAGLALLALEAWIAIDRAASIHDARVDAVLNTGLLMTVALCWRAAIRGRFSGVERAAIYLDSLAVFLTVAAATLVLLATAAGPGAEGRSLALASVFAGLVAAALVLYLSLTPVRRLSGWTLLVGGIPFIGAGFGLRVLDSGGTPWDEVLIGFGSLVCSAGAATWRTDIDDSASFKVMAARIRAALPIASVVIAAGLIVGGEGYFRSRPSWVEVWADAALALLLLVCVGRQTLLLWERGSMLAGVRAAADRERELMAEVQSSERRFRTLVQNSSDVFLIIDAAGRVSYQSPAVERVLGHEPMSGGGDGFAHTHPDDRERLTAILSELAATPGTTRTIELRLRHTDGGWRMIEATGTNLLDDPVVSGIVVNYRDITERKRLEAQLIHEAFHDPLTGLPNRALFAERVESAILHGASPGVAVLFIDLDDFKTINDSLGHLAGDELLAAVARRIAATVRPEDIVSRLSGDEFAIMLGAADAAVAGRVAGRLLESIGQPFELDGKQVHLEASIGMAFESDGPVTAGELLRNADVAMYEAKARGKGRVELFEARMHAAVLTRLELKADLEHAIERNELRVRYQPIYELASGELDGFEALIRWRHPTRGEIGPLDFIPLAEETGLIVPIGRWVLAQACTQARAWNEAADRRVTVSVNLSSRQLREPAIVDWVQEALDAAGLEPELLTLELTESGLMQDDEGRLRALRDLGVHLALDDFGTGYSSLSYLSRFPIDILKVDRSFIAQMDDGDLPVIVSSVLQLGRAMGMATIAEGIERPEQLSRLRALGVGFGQGFLLARPMDAISATSLVADGETLDRLVS